VLDLFLGIKVVTVNGYKNKKRGLFVNPQDHILILNHHHNDHHQNHRMCRSRIELFCNSPYQMWVVILGFKQYG